MSPGKITIKDIARMADVSIGTVDRVIHNRGEVAEKTKIKVRRILQETDYSPNVVAQALKSTKRFNLVSLLPEPVDDNPFWVRHPLGMIKAIKELEPFPVMLSQVTFDMQSEEDFQNKTATVLSMKPDGVLLAPIFKSESIAFCSVLREASIPFVFIDGFVENTDFLAYIGEDVFQSGRVAGHLIDMVTPEHSDILIITIAKNLNNVHHLTQRTNGFLNYFDASGKNKGKKITVNIPSPSAALVNQALQKAFMENPGIKSAFFTGSRSFLAASFLKENGINSVNLVGYDLLDANVKYLKSGVIRFLIGQRPEEQTYNGIKKLFDFLSLRKIPARIEYLPIDIVTSENVSFFLK
jgi:LacI family transcriptional regulator